MKLDNKELIKQSSEYQALSRYEKAVYMTKMLRGDDFYKKSGSKGGKKSTNRPFKDNPELARKAGILSGKSKRANKVKQI